MNTRYCTLREQLEPRSKILAALIGKIHERVTA